jgi:8-oxo-dGTP diphosphatase
MTANRPNVGVGVIVIRNNKMLLGQRVNAHGNHTYNFPGGHLEFGESIETCAKREVLEETGLKVDKIIVGPFTNDIFKEENKHYVTIFALCESKTGEPQVMEPEKCTGWDWYRLEPSTPASLPPHPKPFKTKILPILKLVLKSMHE